MNNYLLSIKTFTLVDGTSDVVLMTPTYQVICASSWLKANHSASGLKALIRADKRANNDTSFHDCDVDVIGEF